MKIRKYENKIIVFSFAHFLIFSLLVANLGLPQKSFAISENLEWHPYKDAIAYVQKHTIATGYDDGTFRPDTAINRAEFVAIIMRSQFSIEEIARCDTQNITLKDIQKDAWYAPYICIAIMKEIIKGYTDNTFQPAKNIAFVEAAKILSTAYMLPTETNESAIWFKPYVQSLENKKAIPASIYKFSKPISRGEMAEMVYRLRENIRSKKSVTYDTLPCVREDDGEFDDLRQALQEPFSVCELFVESKGSLAIPAEISTFENMTILLISNTKIQEPLPPELWNMTKLTELQFYKTGLTSLPEDIGKLQNVQRLDLRDNKLTALPNSLQNLHQIEWIGIGGNNLSEEEYTKVLQWFPNATIE